MQFSISTKRPYKASVVTLIPVPQTQIPVWFQPSASKPESRTGISCQKIQIKACQRCFPSPPYLSKPVLIDVFRIGGGEDESQLWVDYSAPQIPICLLWQLNPLSLNKPPLLQKLLIFASSLHICRRIVNQYLNKVQWSLPSNWKGTKLLESKQFKNIAAFSTTAWPWWSFSIAAA